MVDNDGHRLPHMGAGRHLAARALLGWLDDERSPRLCLVGGSSGSGKSHLLAWLYAATATDDTPPARRLHAFVPAAGLTVPGVVAELAAHLGVAARTPRQLIAAVALDPRRTVIAVADPDHAGLPGLPGEGARIVAELLDPLLRLPHVRLLMECAGPDTRAAFGGVAAPAALNLDEPRWTHPGRFERWYAELATGSSLTSPFGADAAFPHPGLARLAARVDGALSPAPPNDNTPGGLPERAAGIHQTWWATLPEDVRSAVAALFGLDLPLSAHQWERALTALYPAADPGTAAATIEHATRVFPAVFEGGDTWALPAGPLAEFVLGQRPESAGPDRPGRVHTALRHAADAGITDLAGLYDAGEERISAILAHSVRIGDAAALAADPVVQALARPQTVAGALVATGQWAQPAQAAFRGAFGTLLGQPAPAARAALLAVHRLGRDDAAARMLTERSTSPGWRAEWARWGEGDTHRPDRWPGPAAAATAGRGGLAGRVLLVDDTGVIRTVAGADGTITGRVVAGSGPLPLRALASTYGGRVTTLNRWGGVDVLDAAYHGPRGALEAAFQRLVNTCGAELTVLCAHPLPAVGDVDGGVWCHGSPPGVPGGEPPPRGVLSAPLHTGPVTALAAVRTGADGEPPLLLSGGRDGRVRMWSPGADPATDPLDARATAVTALACERTTEGLLIAAAWADGLVRLRRPGDDTAVDLNLGAPVTGIAVAVQGYIVLGMADGVLGLRLERPPR
ncbi:WD40 repeat domain-containing protein [Embleya scabrispora]|uniref:WD40 repeat domain-containing protein n=1 Tax=Embleya scabrispora TaxID=159449 RepID=UPI0003614067|nr:WD40 repeat domain-containing protein [Embleya scabrispora]MYS80249.1 hypothetical protein [Streptomyces sp. SID5474]